MQEVSEEAQRVGYIRRISEMSDHHGNKLIELMEKYGNHNLQEVTKELTDEDQKWLILSVMKRVRDMDYKMYHERLQKLR